MKADTYPRDKQFPNASHNSASLVQGVSILPVKASQVVAITWSGASNVDVMVTVSFVRE